MDQRQKNSDQQIVRTYHWIWKYSFPLREENTNSVFDAISLSYPDIGKVYTKLTRPFPLISNWGMQNMLILYAYDKNSILVKPIKTRSDADMLRAYDIL